MAVEAYAVNSFHRAVDLPGLNKRKTRGVHILSIKPHYTEREFHLSQAGYASPKDILEKGVKDITRSIETTLEIPKELISLKKIRIDIPEITHSYTHNNFIVTYTDSVSFELGAKITMETLRKVVPQLVESLKPYMSDYGYKLISYGLTLRYMDSVAVRIGNEIPLESLKDIMPQIISALRASIGDFSYKLLFAKSGEKETLLAFRPVSRRV